MATSHGQSSTTTDSAEQSEHGLLTSDTPVLSGDSEFLSDESESSEVNLFLSKFKAPKQSDLARKRKIRRNPARPRTRKMKPSCSTDPKSVTPSQRIKEFAEEPFIVSAGKLFCTGCREEVSLKHSIVKNHIKTAKHALGKDVLTKKQSREQDIAKALKRFDDQNHPTGETLPEAQRVFRVKVITAFLKAGVPLNKLEDFREILEQQAYKLADKRGMYDLIPFVLEEEQLKIKAEVSGKNVSIIFDGTTRLGEALAIVIRYVENWTIQQRLICVQMLVKSMTGEEIAREIVNILSVEYGISVDRLLACMHDRASVNNVALRTIKVLYQNLVDIGCYSHTLDHVGERFSTPVLEDFIRLWISLFAHSPRTRFAWREQTGKSMASFSATRWWSRWEVCNQVLYQFGDVLPFLQQHPDFSPATTRKLTELLTDPQKLICLQLELASVIDAGEMFVNSTYALEGDSQLVFKCFEVVCTLFASIQTEHFPNLCAVATKLCASSNNPSMVTELIKYGKSCVKPGLDYFKEKFQGELKTSVEIFKVAQFFVPSKIAEMAPSAEDLENLKVIPFMKEDVLESMKAEFSLYIAKASGVSADIDILDWWGKHSEELVTWSSIAKDLVLIQPSSAAAERVFSILKSSFGPQQDHSLKDYIQSSLMLQYNKR